MWISFRMTRVIYFGLFHVNVLYVLQQHCVSSHFFDADYSSKEFKISMRLNVFGLILMWFWMTCFVVVNKSLIIPVFVFSLHVIGITLVPVSKSKQLDWEYNRVATYITETILYITNFLQYYSLFLCLLCSFEQSFENSLMSHMIINVTLTLKHNLPMIVSH